MVTWVIAQYWQYTTLRPAYVCTYRYQVSSHSGKKLAQEVQSRLIMFKVKPPLLSWGPPVLESWIRETAKQAKTKTKDSRSLCTDPLGI